MFTYQLYNLLHILGIVLVFMGLGALAFHGANGGDKASNKVRGLVMGTHGRKGLDHAFFGSVAEKVMKNSDVPVLVVNPHKVKHSIPFEEG